METAVLVDKVSENASKGKQREYTQSCSISFDKIWFEEVIVIEKRENKDRFIFYYKDSRRYNGFDLKVNSHIMFKEYLAVFCSQNKLKQQEYILLNDEIWQRAST